MLWSRTTRKAFFGHGLWNHVETSQDPKEAVKEDGNETIKDKDERKPNGSKKTKRFRVLGILQNSLKASILEAYSYCEIAKE